MRRKQRGGCEYRREHSQVEFELVEIDDGSDVCQLTAVCWLNGLGESRLFSQASYTRAAVPERLQVSILVVGVE